MMDVSQDAEDIMYEAGQYMSEAILRFHDGEGEDDEWNLCLNAISGCMHELYYQGRADYEMEMKLMEEME